MDFSAQRHTHTTSIKDEYENMNISKAHSQSKSFWERYNSNPSHTVLQK